MWLSLNYGQVFVCTLFFLSPQQDSNPVVPHFQALPTGRGNSFEALCFPGDEFDGFWKFDVF
jgi:hypothetical protein